MAIIQSGRYYNSGYWERVEYEEESSNYTFIHNAGDPYTGVLVYDNIGNETLIYPELHGTRRQYENEHLIHEESASYSRGSLVVRNDVSITSDVATYLNREYGGNAGNDILKALKDSVELHKYTESHFTTYAGGDFHQIRFFNLNGKALIEESDRNWYINTTSGLGNFEPGVSLSWTVWNIASPNARMPRATAYALLNVNDDIDKGLIDVPDYIKPIFKDTLPKAGITDPNRAHWTVNIDGSQNPIVSITCRGNNEDLYNNASIHYTSYLKGVFHTASTDVSETNYYQQPITFSWNEQYNALGGVGVIDKIKGLIGNLTGNVEKIDFTFSLHYTNAETGKSIATSICYARVGLDGSCSEYGIYKESGLSNPDDGSTVTITRVNTDDIPSPFDPGEIDIPEDPLNPDDPQKPIQAVSGVSLLTKSYEMSARNLKKLGAFLWSTPFTENILDLNQSPIENILSCKVFPFNIPDVGSEQLIKIGNVTTDTPGNPLAENTNIVLNIGSFHVPTYYKNKHPWAEWLDVKTSISIFLPYIGLMPINTENYYGKTLNVKYYVDLLTGVCKAVIYVDGVLCDEFAGSMGVDIPITSNNRAQQELTRITSFASAGLGIANTLATGNPVPLVGAAQNIFNGFVRPKDQIGHSGSCSPTCDMMTTHDVFIVISRPKVKYPANYGHVFGFPCYASYTLNNLKGFTRCVNVDVSNLPCTEKEKEEIKNLLEEGIYISPQYQNQE